MSYDLYFYKRANSQISKQEIGDYLTDKLTLPNIENNEWFFENERTNVYYSFEYNDSSNNEDDDPSTDYDKILIDCINTHFSFNLNFLRPNFFGIEAFEFVDKFILDLNLFVLNPQSVELSGKPLLNSTYQNWSNLNACHSKKLFTKGELIYLDRGKSDAVFHHNYRLNQYQNEVGDEIFIPEIMFLKDNNNTIITACVWPEHIPIIFPKVDYVLLIKKYEKLFKTIEEKGFITYETLIERFGSHLNDWKYSNYKLITPKEADKTAHLFNTTKIEMNLDLVESVDLSRMVNSKP